MQILRQMHDKPIGQREVPMPGLPVPHLSPGDRWASFGTLTAIRNEWCAQGDDFRTLSDEWIVSELPCVELAVPS
jgi:hypothetical protein